MSYRHVFFLHPASIAIAMVVTFSARVAEAVFAPIAYLINAMPAPAEFSILPRFKVMAFKVISLLKPDYRLSYLTNGH